MSNQNKITVQIQYFQGCPNSSEIIRREKEAIIGFEDAMYSDWNLEKLNAVVFIQNAITKEVYQTGSTF